MRYSATITIPKRVAISYRAALSSQKEHKRSTIAIKESGTSVCITIEAEDVTALRASINAVTRDVQVIEGASSAAAK